MEDAQIRRINVADISSLQEIGKKTFSETYAAGNSEENMKRYLKEEFITEKLIKELNEESLFYFAEINIEVIGYLKLNFGDAQTEIQDYPSLEIERIYVLKGYHGKGVAQLLYNQAIQVSREMKADYLWLGVWEENPRAIAFYKKNGFEQFGEHIFKLGDDEQKDIMMRLQL